MSPFTPEQIALLNQPLDSKRVKHRPGGGGTSLAYLEGHDVINMANQIFGFGGWGFSLEGVELNTINDDKGEVIGSYYAARVKLTVAGCVPITEEGVCAVSEGRNPRAKIDAHDMSRKGSITDALKRAFRCYGNAFGNSLYDGDLVDGQPRTNSSNNNYQTRPAAARPSQPYNNNNQPQSQPARPAPAPAQAPTNVARPVAQPRPAQATGSQSVPTQAARPVAIPVPTPIKVASPVQPSHPQPAGKATTTGLASQAQKNLIQNLALQNKLDEEGLSETLYSRYQQDLVDLTLNNASDFIKYLKTWTVS